METVKEMWEYIKFGVVGGLVLIGFSLAFVAVLLVPLILLG